MLIHCPLASVVSIWKTSNFIITFLFIIDPLFLSDFKSFFGSKFHKFDYGMPGLDIIKIA